MKSTLLVSLLCVLSGAVSAAPLKVVATVPELAEMTRRIGGEHVSVESIARGKEDIHQVPMRPSFVTKLNRADAVVFLGLTIEHSFLPGLLEVAVNNAAKPAHDGCEGPACIDCSKGIHVLHKPSTLSRAEGEIHPLGNPHYNLDPDAAPIVARNVAEGLTRLDPARADVYAKNLKEYQAEAVARIAALRKLAQPLNGMKAVSYHKDLSYLGRFTGLDFADTLELKPGIAPTPSHLAALVKKMKEQNIRLIIHEQHFSLKTSQWLAKQTGARLAIVGTMANSMPETGSMLELAERNIKAIVAAAGEGGS